MLRNASVSLSGKTESDTRLTFQVRSDPLHEIGDTLIEVLFAALNNSPQLFECTHEITMYDLVNVFVPILSHTSSDMRATVLAER